MIQDRSPGVQDRKATSHWRIRTLHNFWALLDRQMGHQLLQLAVDMLACVAGLFCGWAMGTVGVGIGEPVSNYFSSVAILCFGIVAVFYSLRGYRPTYLRRQERELEIVFKGTVLSFLLVFAFNFLVFKSAGFSRYIYVLTFVFVFSFLLLGRFAIKRLYRALWQHEIGRNRTLVVGQNHKNADWFRQQLQVQQFNRFELVGYLKAEDGQLFFNGQQKETPVSTGLGRFLDEQSIRTVIVALNDFSEENHRLFLDIVDTCKKSTRQIFIVSETFSLNRRAYDLDEYVGLLAIRWAQSELEKRIPLFVKRAIDIVVSLSLIIVLSPLLIVIALAIKLQDLGPIFHRRRVVADQGRTKRYGRTR